MDSRLHEIEEGLERELGALLGSVNFSGYTDRARLRADDLAVRTYASQAALDAKGAVGTLISAWCDANMPEPTSEQPFPPPEITAKLRALRAYQQQLAELETAIRSAPAPDLDTVWNQRTDGVMVLDGLVRIDTALVQVARTLAVAAASLTLADTAKADPFESLRQAESDLRSALAQRRAFIQR